MRVEEPCEVHAAECNGFREPPEIEGVGGRRDHPQPRAPPEEQTLSPCLRTELHTPAECERDGREGFGNPKH